MTRKIRTNQEVNDVYVHAKDANDCHKKISKSENYKIHKNKTIRDFQVLSTEKSFFKKLVLPIAKF